MKNKSIFVARRSSVCTKHTKKPINGEKTKVEKKKQEGITTNMIK
jgi:hypothetical protein